MKGYPFSDIVKEHLKQKGKTVGWFVGAIDKSPSWFFAIKSMDDLQLKTINRISEIMEFDYILDSYKRSGVEVEGQLSTVREPLVEYDKEQPAISVQITIKGTEPGFENNFGSVLKAIQKEGKKAGFKIG